MPDVSSRHVRASDKAITEASIILVDNPTERHLSPLLSYQSLVNNPIYKVILGHETSNESNIAYFGTIIPKGNYQFSSSLSARDAHNQLSPIGEVKNTALSKSDIFTSLAKYNDKPFEAKAKIIASGIAHAKV